MASAYFHMASAYFHMASAYSHMASAYSHMASAYFHGMKGLQVFQLSLTECQSVTGFISFIVGTLCTPGWGGTHVYEPGRESNP